MKSKFKNNVNPLLRSPKNKRLITYVITQILHIMIFTFLLLFIHTTAKINLFLGEENTPKLLIKTLVISHKNTLEI